MTDPAPEGSGEAPASAEPEAFDALILAGGRGRRLGGAVKAEVLLDGRRLLDHTLEAAAGARRTVVVAPPEVAVPQGALRTQEDPPYGGPVAGVDAGLAALEAAGTMAPWVLVLACDAPWVGTAVPRLRTAVAAVAPRAEGVLRVDGAPRADRTSLDGAVLLDEGDRAQWLSALYRTAALQQRLSGIGAGDPGRAAGSMRALVTPLHLAQVRAHGREAHDIDTWADLPPH